MIKFPKDFLWGAATSAYQVEGGNVNSDWSRWEKEAGKVECGHACRHYELYKKDFDLARNLHHNAHRFSIEWGRIEPKEGRFSRKELRHYLDVILALRERGIEPIVTLHHFTNPVWFSGSGGWLEARSVKRFLRYCDFVTRALARHVRYWVTINEPTIYLSHAYITGVWPPQEKSYLKAAAVEENLASAHIKAYRLIHDIYKHSRLSEPCVGIAQNVIAFVPYRRRLKNRFTALLRDWVFNLGFIERVMRLGILRQKTMDFIGVNYYSRQLIELKEFGLENLVSDLCDNNCCEKNSLGWDIYPRGLYDVLMELKKYNLPIMITENGICTSRDNLRWKYIYDHLKNIHRAMKKGVPITGYLYWSLLDNFEWDKGFGPKFGLIGVDRKTYKRTVKRSARKFGQVCKTGILQR